MNSSAKSLQFISVAFGRKLELAESIDMKNIFHKDNLKNYYSLKNFKIVKDYRDLATVFDLRGEKYLFISFTLFSYNPINIKDFIFAGNDFFCGLIETYSYSNIEFISINDNGDLESIIEETYPQHSSVHSAFIIEQYEILESVSKPDDTFE